MILMRLQKADIDNNFWTGVRHLNIAYQLEMAALHREPASSSHTMRTPLHADLQVVSPMYGDPEVPPQSYSLMGKKNDITHNAKDQDFEKDTSS